MAVITMVGAGVMGSALTFPVADNGHDVRLVGTHLDDAIIDSCRKTGLHPRLRRALHPMVQPFFYREIADAMRDADVIGLGVNSNGVHWAAKAIAPYLRAGQTILMVTKGMEGTSSGDLRILPDVLAADLPLPIREQVHYAAIGGPSIAGELAARRETSVVFTSRDQHILPGLRGLFSTPYYHIWTSADLVGIEVCVALKNPYALAVGLAAGLLEAQGDDPAGAKMHNYAAALFAQALTETARLVQLMGGGIESVFSLPGAGDLYVTTQGGRNSRMGRLLGMGLPYSAAVEEMPGETIEGVDAVVAIVPAIEKLIAQGKLEPDSMPLLRRLYQIVTRGERVAFDFNSFFAGLPFTPPETIGTYPKPSV